MKDQKQPGSYESEVFDRLKFLYECLDNNGGYNFVRLPQPFVRDILKEIEQLQFQYKCHTEQMHNYRDNLGEVRKELEAMKKEFAE